MKIEEKEYKGYKLKVFKIKSGNKTLNHFQVFNEDGETIATSPNIKEVDKIIKEYELIDKDFCPFCGRGGEK